jgi:hypothetical protein
MPIDDYVMPRVVTVARIVYGKLGIDEQSAPQETIVDIMRVTFARWFTAFPSLANGAGMSLFTENDQYLFNYGMATWVSAILKPGLPKITPETALVSVRIEGNEYKYASPTPTDKSRDDSLVDEAWGYLQFVSVMASDFQKTTNATLFATNGPRRAARTALGQVDGVNPLYQIYGDVRTAWEWQAQNARFNGVVEY